MKAVIFGASSGIGKALALLLAKNEYTKIVITGRRKNLLDEIQKTNPEKFIVKVHDVTDIESTDKIFQEIIDELTNIDLLIYSSGTGSPNYELDWSKEAQSLNTNIIGATKVYTLTYRFFHKQGFGHLVGISSIAAIRGNRHVPSYFASKAYQKNYLESLWLKGKRSKADIHVTDIIPGFVDTAMAQGDTFWIAHVDKAAKQIFKAIKKKKKRAYITKRWRLIAILLRILPARLLLKL